MPRTCNIDEDKVKHAVATLMRAPGLTVREAMILAKFTDNINEDKVKHAVATLMRAPGITVREAMILAKFTDDEANTKSMQRKVARSMETQIRSMRIRGAPLIAIVAVLGLAADLTSNASTLRDLVAMHVEGGGDDGGGTFSGRNVRDYVCGKMAYLTTSRPTAVNLANAMEELRGIIVGGETPMSSSSSRGIVDSVVSHGWYMLERDVSDNMSIGSHGADDLLSRHVHPDGVRLVTICNTGSLATALGVARVVYKQRGEVEWVEGIAGKGIERAGGVCSLD